MCKAVPILPETSFKPASELHDQLLHLILTSTVLWLQTQFAVTSVSKTWRQIGRRAFFTSLWDQSGAVKHPVQLFGLVSISHTKLF